MGVVQGPGRGAATRKQEALWVLERLVPGCGVNNVSVAFGVAGRLDPGAIQAAVALLLRRYEVLRTVFSAGGAGLEKRVLDPAGAAVEVQEITGEAGEDAALRGFVAEPFELEGGLLVRAGLLRGPEGDVCAVAAHHLVFDAQSVSILLADFIAAYDALAAGGQPPGRLGEVVPALAEVAPEERSLSFWRDHLEGFDGRGLKLSVGEPGAPVPALAGGHVERALSAEAARAVARAQKELGAPRAVILLAVFYVLLIGHGAGRDVVVGCPLDARRDQGRGAIGYHVSVAPLRARAGPGQTFRDLAVQTRNNFLEALGHVSASFEDISAGLPRGGSSWRDRIVRYQFNYLPDPGAGSFRIGGMDARLVEVDTGFSKFDLEFFVAPAAGGIWIKAVYDAEILGAQDVELMLERYESLVVELTADADRVIGDAPAWCARDTDVIAAAHRDLSVAVRDRDGRDLPIGMRGELCLTGLGGADLATGVPARWRGDGTLELLGVPAAQPQQAARPGSPDPGDRWVAELVGMWRDLLGKPALGADSHFFYSGGHSILAAQLAQKAGELAGVQLQLMAVFENPTPAGLAAVLRSMTTGPAEAGRS